MEIYYYSARQNLLLKSVLKEEDVAELVHNHSVKTIYFFATKEEIGF